MTLPAAPELWYSLLHLDLRHPHARDALGDSQAMHRLVQQGFDAQRAHHNVLYQKQPVKPGQAPQILVSSTGRPDWATAKGILTGDVKDITKPWLGLRAAARYQFRLVAHPVTCVLQRRRRPITDPVGQTLWLTRRLGTAAAVGTLSITNPHVQQGQRDNAAANHYIVTYSGTLTVGDPDQLRHLLATGVGRAKAYGCGLLTLAT